MTAFLPDIKIEPFGKGRAMVSSIAMDFNAPVSINHIQRVIEELMKEYQGLIDAGVLSKPVY